MRNEDTLGAANYSHCSISCQFTNYCRALCEEKNVFLWVFCHMCTIAHALLMQLAIVSGLLIGRSENFI